MGAMFLASGLNRGSHPPEILKMATNTGREMLLFRALARNIVPMTYQRAFAAFTFSVFSFETGKYKTETFERPFCLSESYLLRAHCFTAWNSARPCTVQNFPVPKKLKYLRSFLGLANYY